MAFTTSDFEITDLTQLDSTDVNQLINTLATRLQELHPTLDLKRGVFKDTLVYYHAVLEAAIRTNLERYQSARSLQQIELDPTLADDTVVDEVLSNFNVTRKEGTKAIGNVTIELSAPREVVVPLNSVFEGSGKSFLTTKTFTARTSAAQVSSDADRLLVQLSNGNYAFTVEVEAETVGSDSKLDAGDLIVPDRSISGYVTSYATSSFQDGSNTETNSELINELQLGIAAKALSNRTNMRSYLRSLTAYAGITNQSIVGYGDLEMLRDKHTIFPISFGGRVDWYIRTQQPISRQSRTVEATLISIAGTSQSTWQFSIGKDVAPGFYEVQNIRRQTDPATGTGFEISQDNRGNDLTGSGFIPDIQTVAEGAYTAFQTATIQFVDTATTTTSLTVGDTATYVYDSVGLPLISDLQADISSRDIRSYAADALVKAPVPCFVDVTLTINKAAGDPDPNINEIKSAIVQEVNSVGFIGRLDGSHIVDIVHNFVTDDVSVTDLDLLGRIRVPDGSTQYIRSSDSLKITDQPAKMVTAKTIQFFTEVSNVSVNVVSNIPTPS
jgi:hypothetical protein